MAWGNESHFCIRRWDAVESGGSQEKQQGSTVCEMLFQSSVDVIKGDNRYQGGLQMAKVISYPKEMAMAF